MRDDGDRNELQAVQEPFARRASERAGAEAHQRHGDRRGQREPGPSREAAEIARAHEADRKAHLAARGAGQELAERQKIGEGALVEPASVQHERVAKVTEMCDRPAEAGQAQFEEDAKNFEGGADAILRPSDARKRCARHREDAERSEGDDAIHAIEGLLRRPLD